jgi:cytochrome c
VRGSPVKFIESYWPYAATVFDYVKRAIPFHAPGSLSDDEVYALTAFILGEAEIIDWNDVMNAKTLAGADAEPRRLHARSAPGRVQL